MYEGTPGYTRIGNLQVVRGWSRLGLPGIYDHGRLVYAGNGIMALCLKSGLCGAYERLLMKSGSEIISHCINSFFFQVTGPTQKRFFEVGLSMFYRNYNRLPLEKIAADLFFFR